MTQYRSAWIFWGVAIAISVAAGFAYVSIQASENHKREEAFRLAVQQARDDCLEKLRKAGHQPGTPTADPADLKCLRINSVPTP